MSDFRGKVNLIIKKQFGNDAHVLESKRFNSGHSNETWEIITKQPKTVLIVGLFRLATILVQLSAKYDRGETSERRYQKYLIALYKIDRSAKKLTMSGILHPGGLR